MATAWFYVKDDGTATGDGGRTETRRSGAFSGMGGTTTYYGSIAEVLSATTVPAKGDYILLADTNDKSLVGDTALLIGATYLISVDDLDCRAYKEGARHYTTSTSHFLDIRPLTDGEALYVQGINQRAGESSHFMTGDNKIAIWEDCTLGKLSTATSEYFLIGGNNSTGNRADFINCTFDFAASGRGFYLASGAKLSIIGGAMTGSCEPFISGFYATGYAEIRDFDMSSITSGNFLILDSANSAGGLTATFTRCKLPATFSIFDTTTVTHANTIKMFSCDNGDGYHYFHYAFREGEGFEEAGTGSVVRTNGATYDGSSQFSHQMMTTVDVEPFIRPLRVPIGTYELDLTSEKVLTFHFAMHDSATPAPTALTDHDFWLEADSPDNTDNALGIFTRSNSSADIYSTPSTLTTSTEVWPNLTATYNVKQEVPITIPLVAGMTNATVTVYACLSKHITGEGTATEFFICPKPVVT